nr:RecName: Full=Protein PR-L5 [Lupinus luteus]
SIFAFQDESPSAIAQAKLFK